MKYEDLHSYHKAEVTIHVVIQAIQRTLMKKYLGDSGSRTQAEEDEESWIPSTFSGTDNNGSTKRLLEKHN